jgi:hypothetical protein
LLHLGRLAARGRALALAATTPLTRATIDDRVGRRAPDALSTAIILHVVIGRRRPFTARTKEER